MDQYTDKNIDGGQLMLLASPGSASEWALSLCQPSPSPWMFRRAKEPCRWAQLLIAPEPSPNQTKLHFTPKKKNQTACRSNPFPHFKLGSSFLDYQHLKFFLN
jgi:hypothetical protein